MNREEEQAILLQQRTEQQAKEFERAIAVKSEAELQKAVAMQPQVVAWAFLLRSQYEALIGEGFSVEQAMELLKTSTLRLPGEEG